jgi:hypothetical protein
MRLPCANNRQGTSPEKVGALDWPGRLSKPAGKKTQDNVAATSGGVSQRAHTSEHMAGVW